MIGSPIPTAMPGVGKTLAVTLSAEDGAGVTNVLVPSAVSPVSVPTLPATTKLTVYVVLGKRVPVERNTPVYGSIAPART